MMLAKEYRWELEKGESNMNWEQFLKNAINMLTENTDDCIQSSKSLLCSCSNMRSETDYTETKDVSRRVITSTRVDENTYLKKSLNTRQLWSDTFPSTLTSWICAAVT